MEEDYFKNEGRERGTLLWIALGMMLLFTIMGVGIDSDQFADHEKLSIPGWFFYLIFAIDLLSVVAIILLFFFKKLGVFLFPIAIISHFYAHIYFLNTFVYSDLTALFMFVGLGLLAVIPKWNHFT